MVRDRTKHENHPMKSFSAPAYSKDLFKTTRKVRLKGKNIFLIFKKGFATRFGKEKWTVTAFLLSVFFSISA